MSDDERPEDEQPRATVLVFRNGAGQPVAVPEEIVYDAERPYRVYKMRLGGADWNTIAAEEKYPDAQAARYDYDRYMAEARAIIVDKTQREMLEMEVARLDFLQTRLWPAVEQGMLGAIKETRGIIMDRAKVVSVMSELKDDKADEVTRTVVIQGQTTDGFIEGLKKASGDDTPPAPAP